MKDDFLIQYHRQMVKSKAKTDRMGLNRRVLETMQQFFRDILKREFDGRVIDIGCGDRSFVACCKAGGLRAEGIDITDGVNFERDRLPRGDDTYDIAFLYSVIEHINDPSNLLREMKRVLVDGGIVVMIAPNIDSVRFGFYDNPSHIRPYNPTSISYLMESFGYTTLFTGLWTVKKSSLVWKMPGRMQFMYGRMLPFPGTKRFVPQFLKGKSKAMLVAFQSHKERAANADATNAKREA